MRIRLAAAAIAVLALATPIAAHHGWADYLDAEFSLTGTVERANLGGPHGLMRLRAGPAGLGRRAGAADPEPARRPQRRRRCRGGRG